MTATLNVYVGEHGVYRVPDEVIARAQALSPGRRLTDKRTRGAKHLNWWGQCQDLQADNAKVLDDLLKKQAKK